MTDELEIARPVRPEPLEVDSSFGEVKERMVSFVSMSKSTGRRRVLNITIKGVSLSRREIGRRCGVEAGHIGRIFAGKKGMSINLAKRICLAFGPEGFVTIDEMYNIVASIQPPHYK